MKSKDLTDIFSAKGLDVKTQRTLEPREFDILFETLTRQNQITNIEDYLDGVTCIPSKKKTEAAQPAPAAEPQKAAEKAAADAEKARLKEIEKAEKEAQKEKEKKEKARQQSIKNVAKSGGSTVGREIGQTVGKAIAGDLSDIRSRNNLFDDTVRETSLLISLNALCVISVALLFHTSLLTLHPSLAVIPTIESIGVAAGMTLAFYAFQYIAYLIVGNVFGDRHKTSSWIKGFASSQGLLSVILFPLSLITLFYPQHAPTLCIVGFIAFIIARLIFIFKGFRIFFNRISSFFLFLYYLCSLEIIPLILGYSIALNILENLI